LSIVKQGFLPLLSILLISCGGSPKQAKPLFPDTVGAWRLKSSGDLAAGQAPEQIRRLGMRRAGSAEYQGAGTLKVEIYELTSDAGAMEVEQTWKPAADTVAFHKDRYFTVVHWAGAEKSATAAFVRELEKR
jgi:hypothetical protein